MLNFVVHGENNPGVPLLIAHGLFGSARNWGVIAKRLSDARRVIAVDMRNHGASPHFTEHNYPSMAADLEEVISDFGGQADILGHSMGGKAAMVLALQTPDLVRHLIVADIAPVTYQHTQLHIVKALQAVDLAYVSRRSQADVQLEETIETASLRAFLLQSLEIEDGIARWKLNLQALREEMDSIMGFPETAGKFTGDVDFLLGETSDYVDERGWRAAKAYFPNAQKHLIEGAGHWLHAEAPRRFEEKLRAILPN